MHYPLDLERAATGPGGLFYGVYPAVVTDLNDPDGQGRVRIRLPWSPDPGGGTYETWARLAVLMAGSGRGTWFIPDVHDEVLVAFGAGRPDRAYVVGALWNGVDAPPEQMDGASANNRKTILSRQGIRITMDDTQGAVQLRLETPGGQTITLSDAPASIEIQDSNNNSIRLSADGISLTTDGQHSVQAGTHQLEAGMSSITCAMSTFSGVVQSDTNITNSTVSASYTPGAGNIR